MIEAATLDGVRLVSLARPDRRNAMTPDMLDSLRREILASDGAEALVLGGLGPMFCSGFDLELCHADPGGHMMRRLLAGLSGVIRALCDRSIPVVIAAQDAAIAGGCAILGGGDLVVSNRGAKFGYPVVRLGISPAVNAASLHRLLGRGPARRLMLDPALIDADEARRVGLVHDLVDSPEEVAPRALQHARTLASKPRDALGQTRRWLGQIEEALDRGWRRGPDMGLATSIALTGSSEEQALLGAARDGGRVGGARRPGGT